MLIPGTATHCMLARWCRWSAVLFSILSNFCEPERWTVGEQSSIRRNVFCDISVEHSKGMKLGLKIDAGSLIVLPFLQSVVVVCSSRRRTSRGMKLGGKKHCRDNPELAGPASTGWSFSVAAKLLLKLSPELFHTSGILRTSIVPLCAGSAMSSPPVHVCPYLPWMVVLRLLVPSLC
jgi:hypothetical protein